jgi:hypothetical protein
MKILIFLIIISTILIFYVRHKIKENRAYINEKYRLIHSFDLAKRTDIDLKNEIKDLPPIVKEYFQYALKDNTDLINFVSLKQQGGFKAKEDSNNYSNIKSQQIYFTKNKSYLWDAQIFINKKLYINVYDSYINSKAAMKGNILDFLSIVDAKDRYELNEGALQRYLAESVWFPTALLPSQGIKWREIDEYTAEAFITDAEITTSLEFEFNNKAQIISVYTPKRFREINGEYILTPWYGKLSRYKNINGYMIPTYFEVSWLLKDDIYTYFKASVKNVTYK